MSWNDRNDYVSSSDLQRIIFTECLQCLNHFKLLQFDQPSFTIQELEKPPLKISKLKAGVRLLFLLCVLLYQARKRLVYCA